MNIQNFRHNFLKKLYLYAGRIFIFTGLIFIFLRCTERQRLNPLDPQNPHTEGKPQNVQVFSNADTVFLSWQGPSPNIISFYKIYRTQYPSGKIEKYMEHPPNSTHLTDRKVDSGKSYTYQIASVVQDYESPPSDPVTITPGPTYTWVIDGSNGYILKLTHDCQHFIFKRFISSFPEYIAINPYSGVAWILDDFSNMIYALNAKGELLYNQYGYRRPEVIDIHWKSSNAWLLDKTDGGALIKLSSAGNEIFSFTSLKNPKGIVVDQNTNNCWIADALLKKVILVKSPTSVEALNYPFVAPQAVALHQGDGNLWVADSTSVLVFDHSGKKLLSKTETSNFSYLLTVDQNTGDCWVVDRLSVSKYSSAGTLEFNMKGFDYPFSISVNSYDGSCLVVDRYPSRLVRISKDGANLTPISLVNYPTSVSIQNKYN